MAVIPRSQRTNLPPGGSQLPGGSGVRITAASAEGRGIAGIGNTLHQIGVIAQRTNDNTEYEKAVIQQQSDINSIVANNTATISNPGEFLAQTTKDTNKSFTASSKMVNFRNKKRFGVVNERIKAQANLQITTQYYKKTVDISNAQYTISSSELLNKYLDGNISKDDAVNTAKVLMDDRFNNGIWDAEKLVQERFDFNGRIEKLDFVRTYELNPQKAVDTINNSKFLTTEQKTDFLFKMASRIDKAEKGASVALKSQADIKVSKYDRLSLEGKLVPGFVSEDGLSIESFNNDVNNGTIGATDFRRILKQQRDIFDAGGVGDERAMNQLLVELRDNFKITDATVKLNEDFNNEQRIKLYNAIETRNNRAISNPLSARHRSAINRTHKADGFFASSLLEKDISDHLTLTHEIYEQFLLKGESPQSALAQTVNAVGPVPGSTDVSDSGLATLKSELVDFDKAAQTENKAKKGKVDESTRRDSEFKRQSLVNDINAMETQLKAKNFLEEMVKNAGTGK